MLICFSAILSFRFAILAKSNHTCESTFPFTFEFWTLFRTESCHRETMSSVISVFLFTLQLRCASVNFSTVLILEHFFCWLKFVWISHIQIYAISHESEPHLNLVYVRQAFTRCTEVRSVRSGRARGATFDGLAYKIVPLFPTTPAIHVAGMSVK